MAVSSSTFTSAVADATKSLERFVRFSSYTNGDDYVAVLKPTDCDYQKDHKPQAKDDKENE